MSEWVASCKVKLMPYWRLASLRYGAAGFLICMALSCAGGQIAPFGAAGAAAFWIAGHPALALVGALISSLLCGNNPQSLALLCLGICFCSVRLLEKKPSSPQKLLFLCLSWLFTIPVFYIGSAELLMSGLANISLSVCAAVCMTGALRAVKHIEGRRSPAQTDLVCLIGACAFLVYALCSYQALGIRFGVAAACFFLLLTASARGIETAAVAVMLSAGCVFGGFEPALAGSLAICALCASAARHFGKWGVAGAFFCAAFLLYMFVSQTLDMRSASLGLSLYLLIPRRLLMRLPAEKSERKRLQSEADLALLQKRLGNTAEVLKQASPLFCSEDGFAQRQILAVSGALASLAQSPRPQRRRYDVAIGAAALAKAGSKETGDSMGMRHIREQVVLLLSDGMGSGSAAHRESAAAVALLGDLLSIGFALCEALECVNRLLMQRSHESDMFATMDALLFDLASGQAQFVKYGAPPSYILREGKIHTLYAEALPAGIVKEARPALHVAPLRRGDTVVLMTDGAFDALGAELSRTLLESVGGANTANDAAQSLLLAAREKSGADDMTVIVARIA